MKKSFALFAPLFSILFLLTECWISNITLPTDTAVTINGKEVSAEDEEIIKLILEGTYSAETASDEMIYMGGF